MPHEDKQTSSKSTGPHRFNMQGWISCAPFERLLNVSILEAGDGAAVLSMPFFIDYAQGGGLMHGGALVSLADTAVVMAIKTLVPPLTHFATTELQARYLLPVKEGVITARAKIANREGRVLKGQATVYDRDGRAVMEFSSTFKIARNARIEGVTFEGKL